MLLRARVRKEKGEDEKRPGTSILLRARPIKIDILNVFFASAQRLDAAEAVSEGESEAALLLSVGQTRSGSTLRIRRRKFRKTRAR